MTINQSQKRIIIVDNTENSLKFIDHNGNYIITHNLNNQVKSPFAICMTKNEIYIGSCETQEIYVFDTKYNLKRKFGKNVISNPYCMAIDEINDIAYIGDWETNKVYVWSLKKDELINNFTIDAPVAIKLTKEKLFILSRTTAKFNEYTKKFEKIESGSNCIFSIDKLNNYRLIERIKFNNWICPAGLHYDTKNGFLYTIAYELDKDSKRSNSRYLFVLDNKYDCIKKIYLNNVQFISDMTVIDNKLIFCVANAIKVIELE